MKTFDGGLARARGLSLVIGIDQSLTGFGMTFLSTTTDDYTSWVYRSPHRGVDRLLDIQRWLTERIDEAQAHGHQFVDAAMESGVVMSNSALVLGELSATVKLLLADTFSPFEKPSRPLQVPPTSLKKFVTGRGNANKQEVVLSAYKTWSVEFTDDNAADSYCLARLVRGGHSIKYQRETYEKLTSDPKYRDSTLALVLSDTDS